MASASAKGRSRLRAQGARRTSSSRPGLQLAQRRPHAGVDAGTLVALDRGDLALEVAVVDLVRQGGDDAGPLVARDLRPPRVVGVRVVPGLEAGGEVAQREQVALDARADEEQAGF